MHGKWSLRPISARKHHRCTPAVTVWCECVSLAVKCGPLKVRSRRMLYYFYYFGCKKALCSLEWVPLQVEMYSDMSLKLQRFKSSKPNIKEVTKKWQTLSFRN